MPSTLARAAVTLMAIVIWMSPEPNREPIIDWRVWLGDEQLAAHSLFKVEPIRTDRSCLDNATKSDLRTEQFVVRLHVDAFGRSRIVTIVGPDGLHPEAKASFDCLRALRAQARAWRYLPFSDLEGRPLSLELYEVIPVAPHERWREPRAPFPARYELSSIRVILERWCARSCPHYSIELRGDGTSLYHGYANVAVRGERRGTVEREKFIRLIDSFRAADFYSLMPRYDGRVSDGSTYHLTLEVDHRRNDLEDIDGELDGMPSAVTRLEDEVDRLARTDRWIRGTKQLPAQATAPKLPMR